MAGKPRWRDNEGRCPPSLKDKPGRAPRRVVVELANGDVCGVEPLGAATPAGWAADGKGGCRWSLMGRPHDIRRFYVLGES